MYIISSKFPCRKAVFTSSCSSSKSCCATRDNTVLMDLCFTTGENISWKSTPSTCENPLATSLALYRGGSTPDIPSFFLNIHLQPMTLWSTGLGTSSQVLFFIREFISSSIARCHFSLSCEFSASETVAGSSLSTSEATFRAKVIKSAYPYLCVGFAALLCLSLVN
ncbi:hypothetical protein F511_20799 [Dorcoceras hygrometricum]|uniref:Uncharacterized protein n=1 Tax=Dorcoceras hygrometricum TaxID=472368 RepID=A0A2Z7BDL5_9LAMI|nr:hypothetical protein F511_20799 [Dorcoceras hygrometricum]